MIADFVIQFLISFISALRTDGEKGGKRKEGGGVLVARKGGRGRGDRREKFHKDLDLPPPPPSPPPPPPTRRGNI